MNTIQRNAIYKNINQEFDEILDHKHANPAIKEIGMNSKIILSLLFIVTLIFLVYWNTFSAAWHFDDYINILNNNSTHLESFSLENIKKSLLMDHSKNAFRALPRFSLAVNWYFDKDNVFGYHVVNTIIHCITTFALFLLIYHLLGVVYPNRKDKHGIALLSALIWALHPIQISAVTYIVQRMASMAAMFYILSMLFYVLGRKSSNGRIHLNTLSQSKYYWFFLSGLFFICALFSKENTVMLPASLLLMEVIIFQNPWLLKNKIAISKTVFFIGSLLLLCLIYFFSDSFFDLFMYEDRFFNCSQRFLTEFRVLVFYLSLIAFPLISRFCFEHFFNYSNSLVDPLSTFFSLAIIILLLMVAFFSRKKYPLLSFALFFYFLNHVIESSFLGLELAFEHRNYLPSSFLFFPLVFFLQSIMLRSTKLRVFLASFICVLIIVLGISTYNKNFVWNDIGGLWRDNLINSPESGRVLLNYAETNLFVSGNYNDTLKCFLISSNMMWHRKNNKKGVPYYKISRLFAFRGEYVSAMEYAGKAVVQKPEKEEYMRNLMLLQLHNELYDAADLTCDLLLGLNPTDPVFLNDKGFIYLKKGNYWESLSYFKQSLRQYPLNENALLYAGYAQHKLGNYNQSELLFNIAKTYYPDNEEIVYFLLNNSLIAENNRSNFYCNELLKKYSIMDIFNELTDNQSNRMALKLNETAIINSIITNIDLKIK